MSVAAGIHLLAIPTPFAVGRVNVYLIEDEPLTLVDCGPNSGKALDELESGLAQLGRRVEDLGLIVITHQHLDHCGLASILARRSGAEVAALDRAAPRLADYGLHSDLDDSFAQALMLAHGIEADVATALRAVSASFRGWGGAVEVTRPLPDGGLLELRDRTLRVLWRPGHSPSDTIFVDEASGVALAGDHLLSHISSNPLLARPLEDVSGDPAVRSRSLLDYLDSMRATREMELSLVLGGHGEVIPDHRALIDERMRQHDRRAEKIRRILARGEPLTAHQVAVEMWGNIAVTQAFLTLSEVLGHMDLLMQRGAVRELPGEIVRFAAA